MCVFCGWEILSWRKSECWDRKCMASVSHCHWLVYATCAREEISFQFITCNLNLVTTFDGGGALSMQLLAHCIINDVDWSGECIILCGRLETYTSMCHWLVGCLTDWLTGRIQFNAAIKTDLNSMSPHINSNRIVCWWQSSLAVSNKQYYNYSLVFHIEHESQTYTQPFYTLYLRSCTYVGL